MDIDAKGCAQRLLLKPVVVVGFSELSQGDVTMKASTDLQQFSNILRNSLRRYEKSYRKFQANPSRKKVHAFRDSIQRLNAALEVANHFEHSKTTLDLLEELKDERRRLGRLRNTQVELHLLEDFQNQSFYQFLKKRKKKAQKHALKDLENPSFKSQKKYVERVVDSLSHRKVDKEAWLSFQNSMRSQEQELQKDLPNISQVPEARMHELRILSKKLLLQGEILNDLFQREVISLERCREIHDSLGEVRNEVIILRVLGKYLNRKKNAKDSMAIALSIDLAEDRSRRLEEARQKWSENSWQH